MVDRTRHIQLDRVICKVVHSLLIAMASITMLIYSSEKYRTETYLAGGAFQSYVSLGTTSETPSQDTRLRLVPLPAMPTQNVSLPSFTPIMAEGICGRQDAWGTLARTVVIGSQMHVCCKTAWTTILLAMALDGILTF
jgi:hypothetical protein